MQWTKTTLTRALRHAALAVLGFNALACSAVEARDTNGSAPRTSYGAAARIGNGSVRAFVTVDARDARVPLEIGVAITPAGLEGLPAPKAAAAGAHAGHDGAAAAAPHGAHEVLDSHTLLLQLPRRNPTPFRFVQLDWNPAGHEPPGIYDTPHFDFHFWTAPESVRDAIRPERPDFERRASRLPPEEFWMEHYVDNATAAQVPVPLANVPLMGLHWFDVRSPELQGIVGAPEKAKPFTKTFIYGSFDGRFVFAEPMITRATILAMRDPSMPGTRSELTEFPVPARVQVPGYHPSAYRVEWNEEAQEYRVALTQFVKRQ